MNANLIYEIGRPSGNTHPDWHIEICANFRLSRHEAMALSTAEGVQATLYGEGHYRMLVEVARLFTFRECVSNLEDVMRKIIHNRQTGFESPVDCPPASLESLEELHQRLASALREENYELAAALKRQIESLSGNK